MNLNTFVEGTTIHSVVDLLLERVHQQPNQVAYTFVSNSGRQSISYHSLDLRARALAQHLTNSLDSPTLAARILLLFPPGLDYLVAFFGCLYAGAIAVPAYPPTARGMERAGKRLSSIASDAAVSLVLTSSQILEGSDQLAFTDLATLPWQDLSGLDESLAELWQHPMLDENTLAFLQYTSGSTGTPKGVCVSHGNLLANQTLINAGFGTGPDDHVVSWLPLYHDMGLIGAILHPLYLGTSCTFLAPLDFLRRPLRWLQLISETGATLSGAPDFAYGLCTAKITDQEKTELDLSRWAVAFNGAEPVRNQTMTNFARAFASCGFRAESFYPCYGLAEATLFVSGGQRNSPPITLNLTTTALEQHKVSPARKGAKITSLVSCGSPRCELLIVDPDLAVTCGSDQVGEIWVAGPSVARGYFNDERTSKEYFAAFLQDGRGPFLRTGDLGFLHQGQLYINGRIKDLIIIRGRNLYPQDIERLLEKPLPALKPGAGAAFGYEGDQGESLAVVWEVPRHGVDLKKLTDRVREIISLNLDIRVESLVFIKSGSIPKTSSGKIRRRACKALFLEGRLKSVAEMNRQPPPEQRPSLNQYDGSSQANKLMIWLRKQLARLLRISEADCQTDTPLAALGIDSLRLIELQHLFETNLSVSIPLGSLLELTCDELVPILLEDQETGLALTQSTEDQRDTLPLSLGQRAMWFHEQQQGTRATYNLARALYLPSNICLDRLTAALQFLATRHELLTARLEIEAGLPRLRLAQERSLQPSSQDARAWTQARLCQDLAKQAAQPFGTEPLLRVCYYLRPQGAHVLLFTIHHLCADYWSLAVLARELGMVYGELVREEKPSLAELRVGYGDYVAWQQKVLASPAGAEDWAFWKQLLPTKPAVLQLPEDPLRTCQQTAARLDFRLPPRCMAALEELIPQTNRQSVLLAVWMWVLSRYSGQSKLIVGLPAAGRTRAAISGLVGYFVNPLPIPIDFGVNGALPFTGLCQAVAQSIREALDHQDFPFPLMVERLGLSSHEGINPLFQAAYVYQGTPLGNDAHMAAFALGRDGVELDLDGLKLTSLAFEQPHIPYRISLVTAEAADGGQDCFIEYEPGIYQAFLISAMVEHVVMLVEHIPLAAEQPIDQWPLLSTKERHFLLRACGEGTYKILPKTLLHDAFETWASQTPDAPALAFETVASLHSERSAFTYSYRETVAIAMDMAMHLRRLGVGPDTIVAVSLPRSTELYISLLAVLKAGGCYFPLDPELPRERLAYMLTDTQPIVWITHDFLMAPKSAKTHQVKPTQLQSKQASNASWSRPDPAHGAYLIYTSGSTGRPKAVMNSHQGAVSLVESTLEIMAAGCQARTLQVCSPSFDVSIWEVFQALSAGGCLYAAEAALLIPGQGLEEVIIKRRITHALMVPSVLNAMSPIPRPLLSSLGAGGEALSANLAAQWAPGRLMFNYYGPTESSICATLARVVADHKTPSIGVPVANTQAYVLDRSGRMVPPGAVGELALSGMGLARGYYNQPSLTAEKFIPLANAKSNWNGSEREEPEQNEGGARLYKTGDLVRYQGDGSLAYLGRIDYQVKLRGFRIELGEIEACLQDHPSVRETLVTVQESPSGPRLLAYLLVAGEQKPSSESLRDHLAHRLPAYMIPSLFMSLPHWPLLTSGKINRGELPLPEVGSRKRVAAENPAQASICAVWAELLGLEAVGIHDHFFELGGHSLLAARAAARLSDDFARDVSLRTIFAHPTPAQLGQVLAPLSATLDPPLPTVEKAERGRKQLSYAQERLWFLTRLEGAGAATAAYHMPAAFRLSGPANLSALADALGTIGARHECLSTTITEQEGLPVLGFRPNTPGRPALIDLSGLTAPHRLALAENLARQEAAKPFDLASGPLFRSLILRLEANLHVLLTTLHHIIADGWSIGILFKELEWIYGAYLAGQENPLQPVTIEYADYAVWQRNLLDEQRLSQQLLWWQERLIGLPKLLALPLDKARPMHASSNGKVVSWPLEPATLAPWNELARREGVTRFMVFQSLFALTLRSYCRTNDVVMGVPVANRARPELEGLIGFFANTLVLRTRFSDEEHFEQLLRRNRSHQLEALARADMPFERLVSGLQVERDLSHNPLVQILFACEEDQPQLPALPGLQLSPLIELTLPSKFDLSCSILLGDTALLKLEYNADLFEVGSMERMARQLLSLLQELPNQLHTPLQRLDIMPESDRQLLLHHFNNHQQVIPSGGLLHDPFQEHVVQRPNAWALGFDTRTSLALEEPAEVWTYADLDIAANRMAQRLRQLGVGPDSVVAVCLPRSTQLYVALLAVLKAAGCYLPLDPAYPPDRLAFMMADAEPVAMITDQSERVPASNSVPILNPLKFPENRAMTMPMDTAPAQRPHPMNLAYMIYTSGSTGNPKGVSNPHCGALSLVLSTLQTLATAPEGRVLQACSPSFDVSIWEIFLALSAGSCLYSAEAEIMIPGQGLEELICKRQLTHALLVPSVLNAMEEIPTPFLGNLGAGGEALTANLARRWSSGRKMFNYYGPTESAICATLGAVVADGKPPSIGSGVANSQVLVLDEQGNMVPLGVPGELALVGLGLARGYYKRASLTAEKFLPCAFPPPQGQPNSEVQGRRLYRSGDLVRFAGNGLLEFMGRIDYQVKLRGFRIEPGEVEALLHEHPYVAECLVMMREDRPGQQRLVAYVSKAQVADLENTVLPNIELRKYLEERLPIFMVPSAIVLLDAFPQLPNGKIDRLRLAAPKFYDNCAADRPPQSGAELLVADLFEQVLGVAIEDVSADFFHLGGHSLLATRLLARARHYLSIDIPLRQVFITPTVASLGAWMNEQGFNRKLEAQQILPAQPTDRSVLSFSQERLWFINRLESPNPTAGRVYNMTAAPHFRGTLSVMAMEQALFAVTSRHESTRTTFHHHEGRPYASFHAPQESPLSVVDLQELPAPERQVAMLQLARAHADKDFDLTRDLPVRFLLLRSGPLEHALPAALHHIASDGWSVALFLRESVRYYRDALHGQRQQLAHLPIQYADFAAWQRREFQRETLQEDLNYWRGQLEGLPELLELPTDFTRPKKTSYRGATLEVGLDEVAITRLRSLCTDSDSTLFMGLQAIFAMLLCRYSSQADIAIGSPVSGRDHPEVEGLIGFFVNTIVLRHQFHNDPSYRIHLLNTKETTLAALEHRHLPFDRVVEAVAPRRVVGLNPLYQVSFASQDAREMALDLPLLASDYLDLPQTNAIFDLVATVIEYGDHYRFSLTYKTEVFNEETAKRMLHHFQILMGHATALPDQPMSALSWVNTAERDRILKSFCQIGPGHEPFLVHNRVAERAHITPEAIAISYDDHRSLAGELPAKTLTYEQLERQANGLAYALRARGIQPTKLVGIYMNRGPEQVVAMLAILKLGAVWLPLDQSYPTERITMMLADAQPSLVLTQGQAASGLAGFNVAAFNVDETLRSGATEQAPKLAITPAYPAYIIYTSGSTGTPKGTLLTHAGLTNIILEVILTMEVDACSRVLQFASFNFDASIWEVYMALFAGAQLLMASQTVIMPGRDLVTLLRRRGATHAFLGPTVAALLSAEELPKLHALALGGEVTSSELVNRWASGRRLYHAYGPTETTIVLTLWRLDVGGGTPLGRPLAGTRAYVLDANLRLAPIGLPGELYIAGAGLASAYLHRAALTADRFLPDPFAVRSGERIYRTGDRVRWLANGTLDYIGRLDHQIKLRGFRIEAGEIEDVLRCLPEVNEALVILRKDTAAGAILVAYITATNPAQPPEAHGLKEYLQERLPHYMVPTAIVVLEYFPLTPARKVDRSSLPAPLLQTQEGAMVAATPLERQIADIYGKVLGLEHFCTTDNFFELGGTSLLVVHLHEQLEQTLGHTFAMVKLFEFPTVAALAGYLGQSSQAKTDGSRQSGSARRRAAMNRKKRHRKH